MIIQLLLRQNSQHQSAWIIYNMFLFLKNLIKILFYSNKKFALIMAERPEDLNLPITVVQRLIKEAVGVTVNYLLALYFDEIIFYLF